MAIFNSFLYVYQRVLGMLVKYGECEGKSSPKWPNISAISFVNCYI